MPVVHPDPVQHLAGIPKDRRSDEAQKQTLIARWLDRKRPDVTPDDFKGELPAYLNDPGRTPVDLAVIDAELTKAEQSLDQRDCSKTCQLYACCLPWIAAWLSAGSPPIDLGRGQPPIADVDGFMHVIGGQPRLTQMMAALQPAVMLPTDTPFMGASA